MAKLIYSAITSLDGYTADEDLVGPLRRPHRAEFGLVDAEDVGRRFLHMGQDVGLVVLRMFGPKVAAIVKRSP